MRRVEEQIGADKQGVGRREEESRMTFRMFPGRMRVLQLDTRKEWKKGRTIDLRDLLATQATRIRPNSFLNIVTLG